MRFSLLVTLASATIIQAECFKGISDNVLVSSLSIPGTHNTMTKVIRRSPFQCQNTYLEEQLKSERRDG
ncbi:hypothetical protein BROUX41_002057 [Berkeleyomyces rouxiae]